MNCNCCSVHSSDQICMHKVPIFSSLSPEEMSHISSIIKHKNYQKGELLFSEGDSPRSLIIINEGSVKAFKVTPEGREQILHIFSEGDFFGEQNLFGSQKSPYTAEALAPTGICSFAKEDFYQILHAHPGIAIKIIETLGERIARMEDTMQSIGVRNLDSRISGLLLDFADKYGKVVPEGILIQLPVSREGMANYLGIARETISRKLGQLEAEGLIHSVNNKNILLKNREAMNTLAGKDC
ncbi:Crp/Fnr family transcriptional regulator [Kineothrix sp. MB12-C1]|uniref:Crp/Fnr family transcriptional regulator n=1 Tax=Kineothrix sp. MB12-C1 TaxID=3070215 RepID=UPI0027D20D7E|nr:Crp/Fnr family transcriptional regulator [Kineothrix sp. MB12-C1]WMC94212.1 Crp/Fnr family transcriptional regulator [Kineothrix sp. MB12-C1]